MKAAGETLRGGGRRRGREVSTCPQRHAEPLATARRPVCARARGVRRFFAAPVGGVARGREREARGWWVAGCRDASPRCGAARRGVPFSKGGWTDRRTAGSMCDAAHGAHETHTESGAKEQGCVSEGRGRQFPCGGHVISIGTLQQPPAHRSSTRRVARACPRVACRGGLASRCRSASRTPVGRRWLADSPWPCMLRNGSSLAGVAPPTSGVQGDDRL